MKTFYVIGSIGRYVVDEEWFGTLDEAIKFESLSQAFDFMQSSGLQLEILRVDITPIAYDLNQENQL